MYFLLGVKFNADAIQNKQVRFMLEILQKTDENEEIRLKEKEGRQ